MDNLKEILQNLKERFSNPLIFSFCIAWLIVNWQITVGLLWYDTKQIENTGCATIFDFITDKLNVNNTFYNPLKYALLYTLLMPVIRIAINAINALALKYGDKLNMYILKHAKIPYEKYINLRNEYDKRSKILEEVILREKENTDKLNSIETELLQSKSQINGLNNSLMEANEILIKQNDISLLNGFWTSKLSNGSYLTEQDIYIENGRYYLVKDFNNMDEIFRITNFHFDLKSKQVFFIKERNNQKDIHKEIPLDNGSVGSFKFNINNLFFNLEGNLSGQENGIYNIEYKRKPDSSIKF